MSKLLFIIAYGNNYNTSAIIMDVNRRPKSCYCFCSSNSFKYPQTLSTVNDTLSSWHSSSQMITDLCAYHRGIVIHSIHCKVVLTCICLYGCFPLISFYLPLMYTTFTFSIPSIAVPACKWLTVSLKTATGMLKQPNSS